MKIDAFNSQPNARRRSARRFSGSVSLLVLVYASLAVSGAAQAQVAWTGASSDWFDPANWSPAALPDGSTDVHVATQTPNFTLIAAAGGQANNLVVSGSGSGGRVSIILNGTLTTQGAVIGQYAGEKGDVGLSGVNATWINSGNLNVGAFGEGQLGVRNGATVQSSYGYLGGVAGALGVVVVEDVGSVWNIDHSLYVGNGGEGALGIKNGGVVNSLATVIGAGSSSDGFVTVDGVGSHLNNIGGGGLVEGPMIVGYGGEGRLILSNGGKATNGDGTIGYAAGSDGIVLVGTGSQWVNTDLRVGRAGKGTLKVSGGGTVSSAESILADEAGALGTVTVNDAGSFWDVSGMLTVGNAGVAKLEVLDGGTVQSATSILGNEQAASGMVVVDGVGSRWENFGYVDVGYNGTGSLYITDGGAAEAGYMNIATETGSVGAVTVKGSGASLDVTHALFVGNLGSASLAVEAGGELRSESSVVASSKGASGNVTVTGSGSQWINTGNLTVGSRGVGVLSIKDAATVTTGADGTIGSRAGAVGSVYVDGAGSAWDVAGLLQVGREGTGYLSIKAGGAVDSADAQIGSDTGSTGYATVDGAGSLWTVTNDLLVGGNGEGELAVSNGGAVNATVTLLANGLLSGNGTVGAFVASAGGKVAPGDFNTLHVAGTALFEAGSTFEVEVDAAGQNGRVEVTGAAMLNGGTVEVKAGAGSYAPFTDYTILTAATVTGTFDGATANFAFLDPTLSYDAGNVYLRLTRNNTAFGNVGLTPNQTAAGDGVGSLDFGNPVWDAVVQLDAASARGAFDQLSGEIHASAKTALIEDSRFMRRAANERLREEGKGIWGQGFGSWGDWASDGNASKLDRSIGGFFAGVDGEALDTGRFGALAGYSHSSFKAADRASTGSVTSYHAGLYGGMQWEALALRTGAAYSLHDIETRRDVAFPGFNENLKGNYRAGTAQVFGELGYGLKADAVTFEPFANLAHVSHHTNGFTEKGGAAALSAGGETTAATFTTLGLRASTDFTLGGVTATAKGMVGWRHAFGDTDALSTLRFAGGNAFTVAGVPLARDTAVLEAGLDFALTPAATLGVAYSGQFGSGLADQSLKASVNVKF